MYPSRCSKIISDHFGPIPDIFDFHLKMFFVCFVCFFKGTDALQEHITLSKIFSWHSFIYVFYTYQFFFLFIYLISDRFWQYAIMWSKNQNEWNRQSLIKDERHVTLQRRDINIAAKSWRWIHVNDTLFQRWKLGLNVNASLPQAVLVNCSVTKKREIILGRMHKWWTLKHLKNCDLFHIFYFSTVFTIRLEK